MNLYGQPSHDFRRYCISAGIYLLPCLVLYGMENVNSFSPNAVKTQVRTALIAMLLLRFLQLKAKFNWALSNLVALLRQQLFVHRDLWAWIDQPFQPPSPPEAQQLLLALS